MSISKQGNAFIYSNDDGSKGGEITFRPQSENVIIADHTYVDPALRGQGVAAKLLDALAEYARDNDLRIKAHCSYVVDAFSRFAEKYQDVNLDG